MCSFRLMKVLERSTPHISPIFNHGKGCSVRKQQVHIPALPGVPEHPPCYHCWEFFASKAGEMVSEWDCHSHDVRWLSGAESFYWNVCVLSRRQMRDKRCATFFQTFSPYVCLGGNKTEAWLYFWGRRDVLELLHSADKLHDRTVCKSMYIHSFGRSGGFWPSSIDGRPLTVWWRTWRRQGSVRALEATHEALIWS